MRSRAIPVESHLAVLCVLAGVLPLFVEPLVPVSVAYDEARTLSQRPRVHAPCVVLALRPHPWEDL